MENNKSNIGNCIYHGTQTLYGLCPECDPERHAELIGVQNISAIRDRLKSLEAAVDAAIAQLKKSQKIVSGETKGKQNVGHTKNDSK